MNAHRNQHYAAQTTYNTHIILTLFFIIFGQLFYLFNNKLNNFAIRERYICGYSTIRNILVECYVLMVAVEEAGPVPFARVARGQSGLAGPICIQSLYVGPNRRIHIYRKKSCQLYD